MQSFFVEVPTLVRVKVDAVDADTAALVAAKLVDSITLEPALQRVGGAWQLVDPEFIPLDEEDAHPDVYLCRGGKLAYVANDGFLEATDDDCDLAA